MKVIKPDHDRRISIDGVPDPVRRPVDIDQSKTGFKELRTLRIYRFDPGSVIDGHAEEDEVFLVLLSGSAELTMRADGAEIGPALLSAATQAGNSACAAYLPPGGEYRLTAESECDVAYARTTPVKGGIPRVLASSPSNPATDISVVLEDLDCAEKLRVRVFHINAATKPVVFQPLQHSGPGIEALIHFRGTECATVVTKAADELPQLDLQSWETLAVDGRTPEVQVPASSTAEFLVVFASA